MIQENRDEEPLPTAKKWSPHTSPKTCSSSSVHLRLAPKLSQSPTDSCVKLLNFTIEKLPYRGTPLKRTALIRGAIWDSPPAVLKLKKQLGWRQNIYKNQMKTTITWMTEILNRPTLRRFYWSLLKMIKTHRKMKPLTRACKLVCLV